MNKKSVYQNWTSIRLPKRQKMSFKTLLDGGWGVHTMKRRCATGLSGCAKGWGGGKFAMLTDGSTFAAGMYPAVFNRAVAVAIVSVSLAISTASGLLLGRGGGPRTAWESGTGTSCLTTSLLPRGYSNPCSFSFAYIAAWMLLNWTKNTFSAFVLRSEGGLCLQ